MHSSKENKTNLIFLRIKLFYTHQTIILSGTFYKIKQIINLSDLKLFTQITFFYNFLIDSHKKRLKKIM